MNSELKEKLEKLLKALYTKGDGKGLTQDEEGMKDIINIILDEDIEALDEVLEGY